VNLWEKSDIVRTALLTVAFAIVMIALVLMIVY
jgi:hypothetical protein